MWLFPATFLRSTNSTSSSLVISNTPYFSWFCTSSRELLISYTKSAVFRRESLYWLLRSSMASQESSNRQRKQRSTSERTQMRILSEFLSRMILKIRGQTLGSSLSEMRRGRKMRCSTMSSLDYSGSRSCSLSCNLVLEASSFLIQQQQYPAHMVIEMQSRRCLKGGGMGLQQQKRRQMAYSAKKDYKPVNDKAIIPLTLYQINHHLTEDSTFDGQSFYTVSIVGRLENFRRDHNSNMFLFNDGTGKLQGRINLTSGKMPAFAEGTTYEDKYGDYFFVVFKPKFSEGEKKFYIQMIKEIDNYNMITKHFSDVILSSLIRKKNN